MHKGQWLVAGLLLAACLVGCRGTPKAYEVVLRTQQPDNKKFETPAMLVYVLLCDRHKPPPEFKAQGDIAEWVRKGPDEPFDALKRLKRAKEWEVLTALRDKQYRVTFPGFDELTDDPVLFIVGQFSNAANWPNQFKTVRLADVPDQETYIFLLTPDDIQVLAVEP